MTETYTITIERHLENSASRLAVSETITGVELNAMVPAIVKGIMWSMLRDLMEIDR